MKTRQTWILILMLTVLTQAACTATPASSTVPTSTITAATQIAGITEAADNSCPAATPDTKLMTNTGDGYCLLYPAEAVSNMPGWAVINPISDPGDEPGDSWLYVQVQDAAGKTAAQVVDEQVTALGEEFNITHFEVDLDGEQAVVVDGLPGQDSNRQVFVVHGGRLYDLVFMPWYPNPANPTPLENLYTTVIDSFHFLPPQ